MRTSLFDIFKIGIGPSSSHTVGPMRAAFTFTQLLLDNLSLRDAKLLRATHRVQVDLYGSLALTGRGHGTDRAVLLGLLGERPDQVDPATIDAKLAEIRSTESLNLAGSHLIPFHEEHDLLFHRNLMYPPNSGLDSSAQHPNGVTFTAFDDAGKVLQSQTYYSIGGGFIVTAQELAATPHDTPARSEKLPVPFPFSSAAELLATAAANKLTIAELMLANEAALRSGDKETVLFGITILWQAMQSCCARGMVTEGILPGGLNVRRRAPRLAARLREKSAGGAPTDPLAPLDWVSVYAMAVNEENAAGGRVVTAPTNGAAGVIPAVAHYYVNFLAPYVEQSGNLWPAETKSGDAALTSNSAGAGIARFFLTAAAIGILYKENASISGAEVGCQGEVGVACSMAAGGLVAALNGSNSEVEHAAEIAMEHNLGMTCDPIGGLVQIPCIERNAIGAVKAVQACRMAQAETEGHKVTLDQVIETMYRTGLDMQSRYKETSLAGLALNIIEC